MKINSILKGTLILTAAGIISRLLGFYYRIYLTGLIGAEGLGLYQMVMPAITVCMAISCSGITLAISRYTAMFLEKKQLQTARHTLIVGMCLSFSLALICSIILHIGADFLAINLFKDARCFDLIKVIALILPLSAIHNCINSFFLGKCNTAIPAISQLLEQIVRIGSVILICTIKLSKGETITAQTGMAGLFCGELVSCLFSLSICAFSGKDFAIRHPLPIVRDIVKMALPVSTNRIALSLLHGMEALLIPAMLKLSGMNTSESLSVYGILSGMAIPLVMLPSTLINSFSSMLLPTVSKNSAKTNNGSSTPVIHTINTALKCSMLMGILCLGAFLVWGGTAGTLLFGEPLAGKFVTIFAWMCPFLYIGTTFSSILNGLGKTHITLLFDVSSFIMRILLIVVLVPRVGITGYLVAFLVSEIYLAMAVLLNLYKTFHFNFDAFGLIIKPILAIVIAAGASLYSYQLILGLLPQIAPLMVLCAAGGVMLIIYGIFVLFYLI